MAKKLSGAEVNELIALIKLLEKEIGGVDLQNLLNSASASRVMLEQLRKEAKEFTNDISGAVTGFQQIVNEIKRANTGVNQATKGFQGLSSIAQKIQYHQKGISDLTEKEAKDLAKKLKIEKQNLANTSKLLEYERKILERKSRTVGLTKAEDIELKRIIASQKNITGLLKDQDGLYNTIEASIAQIITQQKKLADTISASGGGAVKGLNALLNKLGLSSLSKTLGLDEAHEKMTNLGKQITNNGQKAAGLGGMLKIAFTGLASIGGSLLSNLLNPISLIALAVTTLIKIFQFLVEIFQEFAQYTADISTNLFLTSGHAKAIANSLNQAAFSNFFMNTKEAVAAFNSMASATEVMLLNVQGQVSSFNDLTTYLKYSNEEAQAFFTLGQKNNKSAKDIVTTIIGETKSLSVANKLRINERKVTEEVARASAAVRVNLNSNPHALAKAAFYATKLRLTLDEIRSASESTLDFESSINNQLEYQLLTGKEINIDALQQAGLAGKTDQAAEELNRLIKEHKDSIKGNTLAAKAFANTVGISYESLMDSVDALELQEKVGGNILDIQKALNILMKKGLSAEEAKQTLAEQGLESVIEAAHNAQLIDRAFEQLREGLVMAFKPLMDELFKPENLKVFQETVMDISRYLASFGPQIKDAFTGMVNFVNEYGPKVKELFKWLDEHGKALLILIGSLAGIKLVGGLAMNINSIVNAFKSARGSSRSHPMFVEDATGGGVFDDGSGSGSGSGDGSGGGKGKGKGRGPRGGPRGKVTQFFRNMQAGLLKAGRKPGIMGRVYNMLGKSMGAGGKILGAGGKLLNAGGKIAPWLNVAMVAKDIFDFGSDKNARATGAGGFTEMLGGSGMSLLEVIPGIKWAENAMGVSIPGMGTDDVALARSIFHNSGRDPDDSRFPIGVDNQQMIDDIKANPQGYPESIVNAAAGVDFSKKNDFEWMAGGGVVTRGGFAQVDTGEMYLGANSLQLIQKLVEYNENQIKLLEIIASKDPKFVFGIDEWNTANARGSVGVQ